jgi:RNA polymerase sigma factor (sigma-70 family)
MTIDQTSDRNLVEAILGGERQAFMRLIKIYERMVFHIVSQLIRNPHEHEDLYQDIFLKVYKNLGRFKYESKLSTWIAKIAYTTCYKMLAKKRALLWDDIFPADDGDDGPVSEDILGALLQEAGSHADYSLLTLEAQQILQEQLNALPVLLGTLIHLFYHQEMSHQEIAHITDLPVNTVKSHLHRTRKLLKDRLTKTYGRYE